MSKRVRSSEVCADCSGPGESHRPGPLPSALLARTPTPGPPPRAGRVRAGPGGGTLHPVPRVATRRSLGGRGAGPVPGLSEPGGQGAAALPSLPSLSSFSSLLSQAGRGGGGVGAAFPTGRGLGNPRGGQLEKSTASVLPAAAPRGCRCHPPLPTAPQTLAPGWGEVLSGVGDARRFLPLRLARGAPRMCFPPLL